MNDLPFEIWMMVITASVMGWLLFCLLLGMAISEVTKRITRIIKRRRDKYVR